MSGRDLIKAAKENNEEEALRLIDEENVDANERNNVSESFFFLSVILLK